MFSKIRKLYRKYMRQGVIREEIVQPLSLPWTPWNTDVYRVYGEDTFDGTTSRLDTTEQTYQQNSYTEGYQVAADNSQLQSQHDVDYWRYYTQLQGESRYNLERFEVSPNIFLLDELQCYIRDDIGFGLGRYHARIVRASSFMGYIIILQMRGKENVILKIDDSKLELYGNDKVLNLSELLNKKLVDVVDEICKKLEHEEAILIKLGLGN